MKPVRAAVALVLAALPAFSQSPGDFAVGVGAHPINPKSGNGALAGGSLPLDIGFDARPAYPGECFIVDGIGIEVLAALPVDHDIDVIGVGRVGSTKHLPPAVASRYHFNHGGRVSQLLGVSRNYTAFFEADTTGALAGTRLELDDCWDAAVHAGVDIRIGKHDALRVDARRRGIDTDVSVNDAHMGTAHIDPLPDGLSRIRRFRPAPGASWLTIPA